jgi:CubicO group peptidase (beta-lactamase class C family)
MTVHVSVRSISALLLLSVSLLGWPADALAQSVVAPQKTAPTLVERLDRLAAEFERNRIDLHVPGAVLAIVRGEEVIFARGFGVADIERKTPVTPNTPFFIGSATKAFTATLVGMLVDEGRMRWDDPVETYLPEFTLNVQSKDPNDRATLRDVLSHRTGFTVPALLQANTGLSSDEILRRASSAEALAPFRQRFLYNNVQYLAAGSAVAATAGTSWDALIKARILAPLGMAATRTSLREAWTDPRTAHGYWWDEVGQRLRLVTLETLGNNIDGIAPAGAISSTALDMTAWLRFLLRQGVQDGTALISPAALTTTWTPQIQVGGGAGYGMGWFVRSWQGQRLIGHGGALQGFGAEVALFPDSNLGFVVLANRLSALPSIATQIVPQYLLGELPPAASNVGDLKPYLGRYIANFATFSNEVFTISERNGRLVLDIPSRLESALNSPRADGRWPLVMTDQLAISFDRDQTGKVVGLRLHEGGLEFEVPREDIVLRPEIPVSELQKYVGRYGAAGATDFAILIRNQRLAVRLPNNTSFDLLPPDATGRRATRANLGIGVTFEESQTGTVSAMNVHRPGAVPVLRLTPSASTLPTVDEIMTLRRIPAASAIATMRTTGTVRYPQSAVEGRFTSSTAGDDRLRMDLDLDGSVQIRTVLNKGRASAAASGALFTELTGKRLAQTRLGHPSVLSGDWRKYYDAVRVLRAGALGGRKVYGVQLESAGLPPTLVALDAETGDVLQTRQTISSGDAGRITVTTTYSDYREVGGMRVPHSYTVSNETTGRGIFQVERVEVGVELPPDTFTLQATSAIRASVPRPSSASQRKR